MPGIKVCPNCQNENNSSAKFCYHCGSELPAEVQPQHLCKSCGFENTHDAQFCANCGNKISVKAKSPPVQAAKPKKSYPKPGPAYLPKTKGRKQQSAKPISWAIVGLIVVSAFALYLAASRYIGDQKSQSQKVQPVYEQRSNDIALENKVYKIASKFICSCGSCGEEALDICTCATAQKERQFIRDALQRGQTENEVIAALNTTYGFLKGEFQSQYGEGKLDVNLQSLSNQDALSELNTPAQENIAPASFANRMEIISSFACPCGQCSIDELKDCECSHSGGAQEVKQFIDEKIQRGVYTTDKIIELVELKYGNRIR